MAKYTDANGMLYNIQPGFQTGDSVILSDCGRAWMLDKTIVSAASRRFKDLFAAFPRPSPQVEEIRLENANQIDIHVFLKAICERDARTFPTVADARKPIEMLIQFDCVDLAKDLLFNLTENLKPMELFDAFVLASRLDDVLSACRVLSQGYKWHAGQYTTFSRTLCPNYEKRPWTIREAKLVQSTWVWALTLASKTGSEAGSLTDLYLKDPKYWRLLVGEFMSNLVQ